MHITCHTDDGTCFSVPLWFCILFLLALAIGGGLIFHLALGGNLTVFGNLVTVGSVLFVLYAIYAIARAVNCRTAPAPVRILF